MHTLPQTIADEIFNLQFKVSDQAIDHIVDELDRLGCFISSCQDYDMVVVILVGGEAGSKQLEAELRIDRMARQFGISAKVGDEVFIPAFGEWDLVIEYLEKVLATTAGLSPHAH